MRDAMCIRIRRLGADILQITRSATQRVEELDAAYVEQQRQRQQQLPMRLSPRPTVNVKQAATRSFKVVPYGLAARSQQRPMLQTRPVLDRKSSAGVSAVPGQASKKRKRKTQRSGSPRADAVPQNIDTNDTNTGATDSRTTLLAALPSQHDGRIFRTTTPGVSRGRRESANSSSSTQTLNYQSADMDVPVAENGTTTATDVRAAQGKWIVADVLQVAEANYQSILAGTPDQLTHPHDGTAMDEGRGAPLYDKSNAASADHGGGEFSESESAASAAYRRWGGSTDDVAGAEGSTVGGGTLAVTARPVVEASALPNDVAIDVAETNAPNYYNVVYIHQSTRVRKQSSGSVTGSGYSSGGSGVLRRRLTPHVFLHGTPARISPSTIDKDKEGEPCMVNSYVSAMYAVDEGERGRGAHTGGFEGAANYATAIAAAPSTFPAVAPFGNVDNRETSSVPAPQVIQVELRMPTHRPNCSDVLTQNPSRTSMPSVGCFRFPQAGEGTRERRDTDEGADDGNGEGPAAADHSKTSADGHGNPTQEAAQPAAKTDAAEGNHEAVVAQIEMMEGWRRDRCTSVANRIRRRRNSTFVSPGWQGEYYYYPSASPSRTSTGTWPSQSAAAPSAAAACEASTAHDGPLYSAGVSPTNMGEPFSTRSTVPLPSDEDLYSNPLPKLCSPLGGDVPHLYAAGDDVMMMEVAPGQLSPPLRLNYSTSTYPNVQQLQKLQQRSLAHVGSPAATTTYDVLLQTRLSASSSSTPRSPCQGMVSAVEVEPQGDTNATTAAATPAAATAVVSDPTSCAAAATTDAAATGSGASSPPRKFSSSQQLQQQQRPGSATGGVGAARRRHYPRMEVVVASDYNAVEWAFAGEARRTSAALDDASLSAASAERSTSMVHHSGIALSGAVATAAAVAPSTPLWAAFQLRELAEEEHRRWDARTRRPHGADIHEPIVLGVSGVKGAP
jgi:hypothetical protein